MASFDLNQPLYAPLLPWLQALPSTLVPPAIDWFNREAERAGIETASGLPLHFVLPHGTGLRYEERIWWLGEVETRPGNWHDAFNALVWLAFPKTKAALNRCHHQAEMKRQHAVSASSARGPLRDALTQFDECGVVVVSSALDLWLDLCEHRWHKVFWEARARFIETTRVVVLGHASYDLLRRPHLGLCGKATFIHVEKDWLELAQDEQLDWIDNTLARRFEGELVCHLSPRDFHPLPLLGIPGVTPENENPAYYADTRQFRPLRVVSGQSV